MAVERILAVDDEKVAPTEATVLTSGENGIGEELVASEVLEVSGRSGGPFIRANWAATRDSLIEGEFSGHERGAITGTTGRRRGKQIRQLQQQ